MPRAVVLSAVRTPVGRYGGGLAGVRPDDLAAVAIARGGRAGGRRPGRDRGRLPRLREPGGRGQPQRRAHGRAARGAARVGGGRDRQPALRVGAVRGRRRLPRDRGRRRRPLRRGRRRVDEPRAARHGQAGRGVPARRPDDVRHDARLALPEPAARGAMFPLESMGETGENVAERWGVSREDQDAFALRSQRRWARAPTSPTSSSPSASSSATSTRARTRRAEKLAALKPAFREGGTVTAGNSSGINDGAAALVIASEERARELGAEPLGAFVGERRRRRRPARDGDRPGAGGAQAARARRARGRRPRSRRAERGVRLAEPRRRSASSGSTRSA